MNERKVQLLKKLQEQMKEWEMASVYRDSASENLPTDILTILINEFGNNMEDAMGEFFFMPAIEGREEDAFYFNCVLTLTENLTEERLPDLYEAIAILNYYTEAGTFAVSKAGDMLVYRNSIAVPLEMSDETALELISENIAFSLNASERFADVLFRVSDGRMSMEEFRGLFPE